MNTKTVSKSLLALSLGALTVGTLLISSCSKEENCGAKSANKPATLTPEQQAAVLDYVKQMPDIRVKAGKNGFVLPKPGRDGFSFSDPSPGYQWGTSSNISVVTDPNTGGTTWVVSSDGGSGNAGGTVVAGNTSLDIGMAFCFSADEEGAGGFMLGGTDSVSTGVSMVIGIAGDFEALMNDEVEEDADITDYFWGYALYLVYADEASGSYEVLDWTQLDEDTDDKAVALVFDFRNAKMYLSSEGNLNVSGGSIGFSGNYYEIGFDFSEEDAEQEVGGEVSGFGTMGCM